MTAFVLVHGAFHGAWCWYKLAALLEARGHSVTATDLPGHGRNRVSATPPTLQGYVDHVAALLRAAPEPVVLVGHSMGGAVITGAAEAAPEKISKLVYLTASLGPSGSAIIENVPAAPAGDGFMPVMENASDAFFHDCPAEDVMLAKLCLTPQAREPLTARVVWTKERRGRVPGAYIGCTLDRVLPIAGQRERAQSFPGMKWVELESGHSPFFSMPRRLADALEHLAG
jgi:pimeloyl-ACP methyl ester carboxylesterase